MATPVIFLAFANEQEGRRYLRDLPEELRQLQGILHGAENLGLCTLVVRPNVTLDQIFQVFTEYLDRVAVFHYAGHADSGHLLLESSDGGEQAAGSEGLAAFLRQRKGLQLAFLNGCSTRAQAAGLLDAGAASVVATARAIDDKVARDFAAAFYTELTAGKALGAAFEASKGRVMAAHGEAAAAYYQGRNLSDPAVVASDPADDKGFPWEFRAGNELVGRWNLPDAVGDPLFGLPALPERDLPESPFRHLSCFSAEHAEVFFGRGYQVRELYEQVTFGGGPPILLLYGPSGVGKSSLLDAGLVPRLGASGHETRYCRRDPKAGLMGSLSEAFRLGGDASTLGQGWRDEEARLGKPLVVILDQVEEAFTRTGSTEPAELDAMVAALAAAVRNRGDRPRGRLVLSFRKEWLAEIDRRLAEAGVPRNKVFLEALDHKGVAEAVGGPARSGRLQRQYRLVVEEGLPDLIADNLLADAGSAVAPTLQVLLTKMWERARKADPDRPRFDRALFESLKDDGYLLGDVLDEGRAAIGVWNPEAVGSGLLLDVLAYHTTDFLTAAQVNRDVLTARYAHRLDVLDGLIGQCKDHYLLIEAESGPGVANRPTRLAHDLLAPLVLQRFRVSIFPGQRARRLLENRAAEWGDGKTGRTLDEADLKIVEEGAPGMRAWTADEVRMVEGSRKEQERIKAERAELDRRYHQSEEDKRRAEAKAQHETTERLKEQVAANARLRRRAFALGAALLASAIVTIMALYYRWQESEFQRRYLLTMVDDLVVASPQAVPTILKTVRTSHDAMALLSKRYAEPDLTPTQRAHIGLALIEKDPSGARRLLDYMLHPKTIPQELLLVRGELARRGPEWADELWKTVQDVKADRVVRIRYAAALAAFVPNDPRWGPAAHGVARDLLSSDPFLMETWTEAFWDVRGHLIAPLELAFRGNAEEPQRRRFAASILVKYAAEQKERLLDLLMDADAHQYAILYPQAVLDPKTGDAPAAAVAALNAEFARTPPADANLSDKDTLAGRKANALIILARLGKTDPLWPALRLGPDPRVRTYLIQRAGAFGVDITALSGRLLGGGETDPSVRAGIVQALGEFPVGSVPEATRKAVAARLLDDYARDPDPGVHSSACWVLKNWGLQNDLDAVDRSLAGKAPAADRSWYVSREGETFVIVRGPVDFAMGSPKEESAIGRNEVETYHHRSIPRSFAIGAREVTVREFLKFVAQTDKTAVQFLDADQRLFSKAVNGPILSITWFQAAQYCRWLSVREGIPEAQMCYPPVHEIKEGMRLPSDYLTRTGYRLPTEAEWEYACRAGTETPFSFGSDLSLLKGFAWYLNNSSMRNVEQAHSTGHWKPNGLGLFDMHGNVYEWCFDRKPVYPDSDGPAVVDREQDDPVVRDSDVRVYRGGSFADLSPMLRSAYRDAARPTNHFPAVGFRVARTYPDASREHAGSPRSAAGNP